MRTLGAAADVHTRWLAHSGMWCQQSRESHRGMQRDSGFYVRGCNPLGVWISDTRDSLSVAWRSSKIFSASSRSCVQCNLSRPSTKHRTYRRQQVIDVHAGRVDVGNSGPPRRPSPPRCQTRGSPGRRTPDAPNHSLTQTCRVASTKLGARTASGPTSIWTRQRTGVAAPPRSRCRRPCTVLATRGPLPPIHPDRHVHFFF